MTKWTPEELAEMRAFDESIGRPGARSKKKPTPTSTGGRARKEVQRLAWQEGISPAAWLSKVGIHPDTYTKWARGMKPRASTLERLIAAGANAEYLKTGGQNIERKT